MNKCICIEPLDCFFLTKDNAHIYLPILEYTLKNNYIKHIKEDNDTKITICSYGYCRHYYYNYWYVRNRYDNDEFELYDNDTFEKTYKIIDKNGES